MGKNKVKTQQLIAVPIFHDGPSSVQRNRGGVSTSCELIHSIQNASTLTEQIKHVQILGKSLECLQNDDENYRILVEWMCAFDLPSNLRKVLASNLKKFKALLGKNYRDKASDYLEIEEEVLDTMLRNPERNEVWKNPVQSVRAFVEFEPQYTRLHKVFVFLTLHAVSLEYPTPNRMFDLVDTINVILSCHENIAQSVDGKDIIEILPHLASICNEILVPNLSLKVSVSAGHNNQVLRLSGVATARCLTLVWALEEKQRQGHIISKYSLAKRLRDYLEKDTTYKNIPDQGKLFFINGFLISLKNEVLWTENILFDSIFGGKVLLLCQESCLVDIPLRLMSLRVLEYILSRIHDDMVETEDSKVFIRNFANEALETSLMNWQSASRKVASAVEPVFRFAVKLLCFESEDSFQVYDLMNRILNQPTSRKGKYIALDILMPLVGAGPIVASSPSLISSLIEAIGDTKGNNAGAITDLFVKLVRTLLKEKFSENEESKISLHEGKEIRRQKRENVSYEEIPTRNFSQEWFYKWAKPLAKALVCNERGQASQIANFCIAPILYVAGSTQAPHICIDLLDCIVKLPTGINEDGHMEDHTLWATLEVVRWASQKNILRYAFLRAEFSKRLTPPLLCDALLHASSTIRLTGLSVLCQEYHPISDEDIQVMKTVIPYIAKSLSASNAAKMAEAICVSFLKRFLLMEGKQSELRNFFGFLLDQVYLNQLVYPGTTQGKEKVALSMLDKLLSFSIGFVRSSTAKLSVEEISDRVVTETFFLKKLCSQDVFSSLLLLLHSIWDDTRRKTFETLKSVIRLCRRNHTPDLPPILIEPNYRENLSREAFFLASSPRERESDTGSMVLASIYMAADTSYRLEFLRNLLDIAKSKIFEMKSTLDDLCGSSISLNGKSLPMTHGYIQTLWRCIIVARESTDESTLQSFLAELVELFIDSLNISLSVISDTAQENDNEARRTPLNVNAGAIGANGAFAALDIEDENEERLSMQRVVVSLFSVGSLVATSLYLMELFVVYSKMGCWLLAKEACAALAAVACIQQNDSVSVVQTTGDLLISTLISLKHAGGSFAAHRALSSICTMCQQKEGLSFLPKLWADQLYQHISEPELVKDSILRRSTGYALGFLAVMRSDLQRGASNILCPWVISRLVFASFPPRSIFERKLEKLGLSNVTFMFNVDYPSLIFIKDNEYQWKSRVHALNILRFVIMDAPLSREVKRYISDCIIVTLAGYDDERWAVRNSSTMAFAAIMLRVIDADKNASRSHCQKSKTAISAQELFRLYPALPSFLVASLKEGSHTSLNFSKNVLHPSLFPILLLLSRLQPLSEVSLADMGAAESIERFVEPVLSCLAHPHHKVRLMAARAIAVLCSGGGNDIASWSNILNWCNKNIRSEMNNMNLKHGILLCMKHILEQQALVCADAVKIVKGTIRYHSLWCLGETTCPPSCVSVALECWYQARCNNFEIDETLSLESACLASIRISLQVMKLNEDEGASYLCTVTSTILVNIWVENVFSVNLDHEDRKNYVNKIVWLLNVPSFDTYWSTIKAFKKPLLEKVKGLVEDLSVDTQRRRTVLSDVMSALLTHFSSIQEETCTTHIAIKHPPSLRRLSRCILIVADGLESLSADFVIDIGLWPTMKVILDISQTMLPEDDRSCWPLLRGNIVELMGYMIRAPCLHSDSNHIEYLNEFIIEVSKCIDPNLSWIIRYSAAKAMGSCGLFNLSITNVIAPLRSIVSRMYSMVVTLCQDADDDVQKCAVAALCGNLKNHEGVGRYMSRVPLITLENVYTSGSIVEFSEEPLLELLQTLEKSSQILENVIDSFSSDKASNLGVSDRKIFEEENPNPNFEDLLIDHFCILAITQESRKFDQKCLKIASALYQRCATSLEHFIVKRNIYDETNLRSVVFPKLHGLVLCCVACYFHGCNGIHDTCSTAHKCLDDAENFMHPSMLKALNLLSICKEKVPTKECIYECLFLVPSLLSGYAENKFIHT